MDIPQLRWDLEHLLAPVTSAHSLLAFQLPTRRCYSPRLLPYWFSCNLLLTAAVEQQLAYLDVLEIQPDLGQLKAYTDNRGLRLPIRRWDAAGPVLHRQALASHAYDACHESDIYSPGAVVKGSGRYHAIFLLHSLERQLQAAPFLHGLTGKLQPGGVIIGACRQEGRRAQRMNPARLRQLASDCGLIPRFIAGSVWGWRQGYLQEAQSWRLRAGLLLGALLPSQSRELYWLMQLPPKSALISRK